jgi:hypothetical protein
MKTNTKKVAYIMGRDSIILIVDGKRTAIPSSDLRYEEAREAVLHNDTEKLSNLGTVAKTVQRVLGGMSNLEITPNGVLWRGKPVHGIVVDKIVSMTKAGYKGGDRLVKFLANLMDNPSSQSVDELYQFLSYKELPIDEDGFVVCYKAVNGDFWSVSGNTTTRVLKGKVDASGRVWNGIGEEIEVERNSVDDNRNNHCSFGLHVGSYSYAKGFLPSGGRLILVRFNPRDAVSVPTDCQGQKLRVCRYWVVGEAENELDGRTGYDTRQPDKEDESLVMNDKNSLTGRLKSYLNNNKGKFVTVKQIQSSIGYTCAEISREIQKLLDAKHLGVCSYYPSKTTALIPA